MWRDNLNIFNTLKNIDYNLSLFYFYSRQESRCQESRPKSCQESRPKESRPKEGRQEGRQEGRPKEGKEGRQEGRPKEEMNVVIQFHNVRSLFVEAML